MKSLRSVLIKDDERRLGWDMNRPFAMEREELIATLWQAVTLISPMARARAGMFFFFLFLLCLFGFFLLEESFPFYYIYFIFIFFYICQMAFRVGLVACGKKSQPAPSNISLVIFLCKFCSLALATLCVCIFTEKYLYITYLNISLSKISVYCIYFVGVHNYLLLHEAC